MYYNFILSPKQIIDFNKSDTLKFLAVKVEQITDYNQITYTFLKIFRNSAQKAKGFLEKSDPRPQSQLSSYLYSQQNTTSSFTNIL